MPFLPDLDMEYDPDGNKEQVAVVMKGQTYRDAGLKQSQFPDIEGPLYDKLCQFPRHKVRDDVRKLAMNIAIGANEKKFQPTVAWLDNFMRRFCISRKKMGIYSSKMLKVKGAKGKKLGNTSSLLNLPEIKDSLTPPSDNIDFLSTLGIPNINESSSLNVAHQNDFPASSSNTACNSTNNHDETNGNSLTVPPSTSGLDSEINEGVEAIIASFIDSEVGVDKGEKELDGQTNGIKSEANDSSDAESIKEIPRERSPEKEVINLESESEEDVKKLKDEKKEEEPEIDRNISIDKENTHEERSKKIEHHVTFCEDINDEEEIEQIENDGKEDDAKQADNEDDAKGETGNKDDAKGETDNEDHAKAGTGNENDAKAGTDNEDDGKDDNECIEKDKTNKAKELTKDDEEEDKETEEKDSKSDRSDSEKTENDSDLVVKATSWDERNYVKYSKADRKYYRQNETSLKRKLEEKLQNCTACFDSINHNIKEEVFTHPVLGVLMCKKCAKFYGKGNFKKDSEGYDEYCRWCANGGDLLICDHCTNGFCKKCIKRNLGRTAETEATKSRSWKCYVCELTPLVEVRAVHKAVLDNIRSISILSKSFTRKERRDFRIKERFSAFKLKRRGRGLEEEGNLKKDAVLSEQIMKDVKDLCVYCVEQLEEIYKRKSKGSGDKVETKARNRLFKLADIMEKNFSQVKSSVKESLVSGKEDSSVSIMDSTPGDDKVEDKEDVDPSNSVPKSPEHAPISSDHSEKRKRQDDSLDDEVPAKRVVLETDSEGMGGSDGGNEGMGGSDGGTEGMGGSDGGTPKQKGSSAEEELGASEKKDSSERRLCDKDSSNEDSIDEEGGDDRCSSKNPLGESDNEMDLGSESEYGKSKNDSIKDAATCHQSVSDQPATENDSDDADKGPSQSLLKNGEPSSDDDDDDAEVDNAIKKSLLLSKSSKFRKKKSKVSDDERDDESDDKEKKDDKADLISSLVASDSDSATDDKKVKKMMNSDSEADDKKVKKMMNSDSEADDKKVKKMMNSDSEADDKVKKKMKDSDSETETNKKEKKNKISDKKDKKSKNSDDQADDKKDVKDKKDSDIKKDIKSSDSEDTQDSDKKDIKGSDSEDTQDSDNKNKKDIKDSDKKDKKGSDKKDIKDSDNDKQDSDAKAKKKKRLELQRIDICDDSSEDDDDDEYNKIMKPKPKSKKKKSKVNRELKSLLDSNSDSDSDDLLGDLENLDKLMKKNKNAKKKTNNSKRKKKNYKPRPKSVQVALKKRQLHSSFVKVQKLGGKALSELKDTGCLCVDDYPEFCPDDDDLMLDSDTDKELEALLKMKAIKIKGQRDSSDNDADSESNSDDDDSKGKKKKKGKHSEETKGKKKKKKEGLLDIDIDKEEEDNEEEEDEEGGGKKKKGVDRDGLKALINSSEDDQDDDEDEELDDGLEKLDEEEIAKKKKELYEKNKKKLKENSKKESESDEEEIQKKVRKKGFLSFKFSSSEDDAKDDDEDDDSEREMPRKSRMFIDSDSDFEMTKKRKKDDDLFSSSDDDDDDDDEGSSSGNDKKKKSKSRKRIKRPSSSTEEEGEGEGGDDKDVDTPKKRRRHIIRDEDLLQSTKDATLEEKERRDRVKERQLKYNKIFEIDVESDQKDQKKLVLDFEEESKKELVVVHEKLVSNLKPHQIDGIRFMWDATIESHERLEKKEKGGGCILAHCMGLGKTLQVIAYIHTLLTCKKVNQMISRVMVCCPVNTVYNWVAEFKFWVRGKLDVFDVVELISAKDLWARAYKLDDWYNEGGVCIIGYDMFRNLSNANNKRYKGAMKDKFQKCLVNPGPDLMVCDEGHILKNEKTALAIAINKIKTYRRIVLTGTPLQNNLKEYHCMIQFVKPNLLGSKKEFMNRFVHPIEAGQCVDALPRDVRRMKRRAHILHNLLEGCVQRFDYSVLKPFLPPKYEYVISVQMCDVQCKLYEYYLQNLAQGGPKRTGSGLFVDFQNLSRIWSHPVVLFLALRRRELKGEDEDDVEELEGFIDDSDSSIMSSSDDDKPKKKKKKKKEENDNSEEEAKEEQKKDEEITEISNDTPGLTSEGKVRPNWWRKVLEDISGDTYDEDDFLNRIEISGKLYLLFDILRESCSIGDKVLLFSQSILALDMIEEFLRMWDMGEIKFPPDGQDEFAKSIPQPYTRWKPERDYYRLDGSTSADVRNNQCKSFNSATNERCRLFLISTRAGGVGINLVAANRVIIFDASWNPSHDTQSIFRVYRFGQKKPCYIYRFVAQGTMEEKIYSRQVTKISTSLRVVDEHQIKRYFNMAELAELYQFTPSNPENRETPVVPEDRLLAELLIRNKNWIVGYHEQDSLLENQTGEELTEEERNAAWEDYENEKKGIVPQRGGYQTGLSMPSNVAKFDIESIYQSIVKSNPGATTVQIYDSVYLATQQIQKVHLSQYQSIQSLMYNLKNPMIAPEILRNMSVQDPNTLLQHLDMQLKNLEENIRAESKVIKQIASITHTAIPHNSMVSAGLARGNPVPGSVSSTAQYVSRNFTTSTKKGFVMPGKTSEASTSAAHSSSASTSNSQSDPLNISSDKEPTDPAEVVTLE